MKKTMCVPKTSLRFTEGEPVLLLKETDGVPVLKMQAYSGGVIDHWYFGKLAIDSKGIKYGKSRFPILAEHDLDRKIGSSKKLKLNEDGSLSVDSRSVAFLDNAHAQEFIGNASKNFPYQASISIKPTAVQELADGEKAEVNGRTMKGPGVIFRKSDYREVSVCVFGADSNTYSKVGDNSDGAEQMDFEEFEFNDVSIVKGGAKDTMDIQELKDKHKDLVDQIQSEAAAAAAADIEALQADLAAAKDELNVARQTIDAGEAQKTELAEKVKRLEKRDAIRTEQELRAKAAMIWDEKLSSSNLPVRLHDKIRGQVSCDTYISDDTLDVQAFGAAIDEEIQSWHALGLTDTVIGVGTTQRQDTSDAANLAEDKEDDAAIDRLLNLAGFKEKA